MFCGILATEAGTCKGGGSPYIKRPSPTILLSSCWSASTVSVSFQCLKLIAPSVPSVLVRPYPKTQMTTATPLHYSFPLSPPTGWHAPIPWTSQLLRRLENVKQNKSGSNIGKQLFFKEGREPWRPKGRWYMVLSLQAVFFFLRRPQPRHSMPSMVLGTLNGVLALLALMVFVAGDGT